MRTALHGHRELPGGGLVLGIHRSFLSDIRTPKGATVPGRAVLPSRRSRGLAVRRAAPVSTPAPG